MAKEKVLKYLVEQNRPYSATDVTGNLRGELSKAVVQKALEELAAENLIKEKSYGKQKVYCPLQEDSPLGQEQRDTLDQQIKEKAAEVSSVDKELKASDSTLKELLATGTTQQIEQDIAELKKINERLRQKLETLKTETVLVSADEKEAVSKQYTSVVKEYKKRKRIFSEIADSILENSPFSKKKFFEEIGVETDEDVFMPPLALP